MQVRFFLKASRHRAGIMGIERTIQQTHANTDKNISQAFQDLTKLMEKVCITVYSSAVYLICISSGIIVHERGMLFKSQHLLKTMTSSTKEKMLL